jgi:hypothetical protein
MSRNKTVLITGIAIAFVCLAVFMYKGMLTITDKHVIKRDFSNVSEIVNTILYPDHSKSVEAPITIHDYVDIEEYRYYLIESVNSEKTQIGFVRIKRSHNGIYIFDELKLGGSTNFSSDICKTDNKTYLIYGGRNPSEEIKSVYFRFPGSEKYGYEVNIKGGKRFLFAIEIDKSISDVKGLQVKMFSESNEDITYKYEW